MDPGTRELCYGLCLILFVATVLSASKLVHTRLATHEQCGSESDCAWMDEWVDGWLLLGYYMLHDGSMIQCSCANHH